MNPFASTPKYTEVKQETLEYNQRPPVVDGHSCTDMGCGVIFIACLCFLGYTTQYGLQNGDPRRIYHGMDHQSRLCGVAYGVPDKPYLYWCFNEKEAVRKAMNVDEEFQFNVNVPNMMVPICVATCPLGNATQSLCYDKETNTRYEVADYATRGVGGRFCMPQSRAAEHSLNKMLDEHPVEQYVQTVTVAVRKGWRLLIGLFVLANILSLVYLTAVEYCAGVIVWLVMFGMVVLPGAAGAYLISASEKGGLDGIPHSGDKNTVLSVGIVFCTISGLFLFVCCCMRNAINKAIKVVETSAECLVENRSFLVEPIVSLIAKLALWAFMLVGLANLISAGEVRKSKVYRTFTFDTEQWVYIVFHVVMFVWLNDFLTACSQYSIANAVAKWYFTEVVGKKKSAGACLLCRGYCNVLFHFGSLAFGSLVIAILRPIRIIIATIVYSADIADNAACGCIGSLCSCCFGCFHNVLEHISKTAFIDMAITSLPFCAAGADAAKCLTNTNNAGGAAIAANYGVTWLFSLGGMGTVTIIGCTVAGALVTNVERYTLPSSDHYIENPVVFVSVAGVVCFTVSLCFMLVFDSITDSLFVCMAKEAAGFTAWKTGCASSFKAPKKEKPSGCASFFTSKPKEREWKPPVIKKTQYAPDALQKLVGTDQWK